MELTVNFYKKEFDSNDGSKMPEDVLENIKLLAKELQVLRDYLGVSIHINSGYRSPEYNKKIGGVKNSYHTKGIAADISVKDYTPKQLAKIVKKLRDEGKLQINAIGLYNGFIHVDIRKQDKLSLWDNSSWYNFW